MEGEYIDHFSHEQHKLKPLEVDENEDPKPYLCNICRLPILYTPSYTCSADPNCNFFLHKACTTLPPKLNHPNHDPDPFRNHPLDLVSDSHNFTYRCSYQCEFDLHPLVAQPVEITSKHKSHQHALKVICRETLSRCDACGKEHRGFFFCCQVCSFWIHQECSLLPSFVRLRSHFDHLLFLTYSLPSNMLQGGCCLCKSELHLRHHGVYLCGECDSVAHLNCVKSSMEDLGTEARLDLIQLPIEGDTFPSSVISRYLDSHPITKPHHDDHNQQSLITLQQGLLHMISKESSTLVCDVCIQPINTSSPFYKCHLPSNDDAIDLLAHDNCAHHLGRHQFSFGLKPFLLPRSAKLAFNSVFPCFYCRRPCNGFCFYIDNISFSYFFDLECLSAPRTLKHASHRQHVLFRLDTNDIPPSCCPGESLYLDVYTCTDCSFSIHMRCAFLPKSIRHKFDEHPLELITDNRYHGYRFCEVCEEEIDQLHWYYGCGKCEFYFHVDCIPAVGYLSRVKFGEALAVSGIHNHPVTLTRMLTNGRHERCGKCKKTIEGCVDDMAFSCADCDFWLHFSCARDSCSSPADTWTGGTRLSKVFSEVEDDYFTMFSRSTADSIRSLTIQ